MAWYDDPQGPKPYTDFKPVGPAGVSIGGLKPYDNFVPVASDMTNARRPVRETIDETTGVPAHVRRLMAATGSDKDQLRVLSRLMGNAEVRMGDHGAEYKKPDGQWARANEKWAMTEKTGERLDLPGPFGSIMKRRLLPNRTLGFTEGDIESASVKAPVVAGELGGMLGGGMLGLPAGPASAVAGAGLGAAAGKKAGEIVQRGQLAARGIPYEDTRTVPEQLLQTGEDVAGGASAEVLGRGLPDLIKRGMGKLTFKGAFATKEGQSVQAAAQRQGVPLSADMATTKPVFQNTVNLIRQSPIGTPLQDARKAAVHALDEATTRAATTAGHEVGQLSPSGLAGTLRGILSRKAAKYDATLGTLVQDLQSEMSGKKINLQPIKIGLKDLRQEAASGGTEIYTPHMQDALSRLEAALDAKSFQGLWDAKVALNKESKQIPVGVIAGNRQKYLQRAARLAQEAVDVSTAQASPEAEVLNKKVTDWVKLGRNPKNPLNQEFIGKLADEGKDNDLLKLIWGSGMKNSEKTRMVGALRKSATASEWKLAQAQTLYTMGRADVESGVSTLEEFDPKMFLTNMRKLPTGARAIMFGGTGRKGLPEALDNLADQVTLAEQFAKLGITPKSVESAGAVSGGANTRITILRTLGLVGGGGGIAIKTGLMTPGAVAGAVGGAAATAAGYWIGGHKVSQLLTNPKIVRHLTGMLDMTARNPYAMSSNVARLWAMTKGNDALRDATRSFIEGLRSQGLTFDDPTK